MTEIKIEKAQNILDNFEKKKILIIGDFYLDEYISTTSEHYSPEAPVPRAIIKSRAYVPGAAGNVSCNFRAEGAKVKTIGVIGNDREGKLLKTNLERRGIETGGLLIDESRVTGTFSRILLLAGGNTYQHVIRIDQENKEKLSKETTDKVLKQIEKDLPDCDAVFVADYDEAAGTGLINQTVLDKVTSLAKQNNVVTIGISRLYIKNFKNFDVIISNQPETETATNIKITDNATLKTAGKTLKETLQNKIAIISLGKDGLMAFGEGSPIRLPSFAKKIVDVCGAGDTLSTTFTLAHLSGGDLKTALEIASFASAAVIAKDGTATISRSEILDELIQQGSRTNKIMNPLQLVPIIENAKSQKKKIIFTNGYFDFIHAGHIQFLQEAKKLGDILVVALNSDESTKANKGANRPLINQEDRAKIMASFDFVDYVTIFEELTPIKIIKTLQPNVLVKGGTYTKEEIIGKDILETKGVEVVILPLIGPSTETMIEHIQNTKKSLHD